MLGTGVTLGKKSSVLQVKQIEVNACSLESIKLKYMTRFALLILSMYHRKCQHRDTKWMSHVRLSAWNWRCHNNLIWLKIVFERKQKLDFGLKASLFDKLRCRHHIMSFSNNLPTTISWIKFNFLTLKDIFCILYRFYDIDYKDLWRLWNQPCGYRTYPKTTPMAIKFKWNEFNYFIPKAAHFKKTRKIEE